MGTDWRNDLEESAKAGEKVTSLCGKRVYGMPDMDESIPTCTPCNRLVLKEHRDLAAKYDAVRNSHTIT